ncbi:MAG: antibiotic acetyltransferase [Bacteroidetes bacterium]|nr:antibiotic acetyltransferase [Bacteroidota bacterium]
MISFFKKIIRKKLKSFLGIFDEDPNASIYKSKIIGFPKIHPDAKIQFSEIRGNVELGPGSLLNKVLIDGNVTIGKNTTINGPGTEIYALVNPIIIGSYCSIARLTSIQEHNHNSETLTTYFIRYRIFGEKYGVDAISKGPIIIGNDVWIGTQCSILTGVQIGHGAVIAANSVVTSDVPPYAVVGGTPAKVLKYRFSQEIIERLLEIQWWDWDYEKIKTNSDLFRNDLNLDILNQIK